MLQQTRVASVEPYFERFLARFPDIRALAAAEESEVLALWAGLGYYTRARNLLKAARLIAQTGGKPPRSADAWQALPGIGRYTAAAIASITSGERVAVLDGNVKRVLARILNEPRSIDAPETIARLWAEAERLLDPRAPGDFNQALMELGATVCTPRRPRCADCPINRYCAARDAGTQSRLPIRSAKRPPRRIYSDAALVTHAGRVYLVPRAQDGALLRGFWTLPGCELVRNTPTDAAPAVSHLRELLAAEGLRVSDTGEIREVRHLFTHRDLLVRVHSFRMINAHTAKLAGPASGRWVDPANPGVPLSTLDRKLLRLIHNG